MPVRPRTRYFDFVPSGGAVTETRDIVQTSACQECHGSGFAAHGGDRLQVGVCVTCHNQSTTDAQSGNTLDMKQLIHKIHAGGELQSKPGPDGILFDDPATPQDESADNGTYAIYGFNDAKNDWWKVEFPAVIENCTKCHQGSGAQVDNWKTVPSRAACGSCHDLTDFVTGTGHPGGVMADDATCTVCHQSTGTGLAKSVVQAHDFMHGDVRNVPEFDIDLTLSTPANGQYFVPGEAPVVTVVLKDKENGDAVIDHTTMVQDSSAEGCVSDPCPAKDGKFTDSSLYVSGPRARRVPVLTTNARARVLATSTGPFDISAANATLDLVVDGGKNINSPLSLNPILGTISVKVSTGTFADPTAATAAEIMTWLNSDANFTARCLAYIDEATGKLAIRTKKIGLQLESSLSGTFNVQLTASAVATSVFGNDLTVHTMTGNTVSNQLYAYTNPANNDPKVVRTAGNITYTARPGGRPGAGYVHRLSPDRGPRAHQRYQLQDAVGRVRPLPGRHRHRREAARQRLQHLPRKRGGRRADPRLRPASEDPEQHSGRPVRRRATTISRRTLRVSGPGRFPSRAGSTPCTPQEPCRITRSRPSRTPTPSLVEIGTSNIRPTCGPVTRPATTRTAAARGKPSRRGCLAAAATTRTLLRLTSRS